ncbi:MAG: nuclear transport factor 2 family protein [Caldilineaceae bacterium]|jgi:limonene-1,2-epoxide hydrolase|nr:nuclear transport factor 2 family protein [Caldilineaceae bacterium]
MTSHASNGALLESIRLLVDRQAEAWRRNNFDLAAGDWLPHGVLISPGGEFPASTLRATMHEFHASFADLQIEITNLFASPDGTKVAIEWLWSVTRRRDGVRGTTADAIIVDLVDGKILSWREYFDLAGSVEA